jgi:hypothetical protein
LPSNLDDYYSPDVNSNLIPLPGVKTATGLDCSAVPKDNGGDWTGDFDNIKCYDQLKVNAVLNWIQGNTHLGNPKGAVSACRPQGRNNGAPLTALRRGGLNPRRASGSSC